MAIERDHAAERLARAEQMCAELRQTMRMLTPEDHPRVRTLCAGVAELLRSCGRPVPPRGGRVMQRMNVVR